MSFTANDTCIFTHARGPHLTRYVGTPVHILITPKAIAWRLGEIVVPAGAFVVVTYDTRIFVCYPEQLAPSTQNVDRVACDWSDCMFEPYLGEIKTEAGRTAMLAHVARRQLSYKN